MRLVEIRLVNEQDISPSPAAPDDFLEVELGRGSSGIVYRGVFDNDERAVKVVNPFRDARSSFEFRNEVRLMMTMNSEYIVRGYGAVLHSAHPTIVMELCEQGPLKKMIGHITIKQKLYAIRCIAGGLKYLHGLMLAHRDLKTENIFVNDVGHVKVGDFGLVKMIGGTKTKVGSVLGTPSNMAPEVACGACNGAEWMNADMWSLGMIIAELFGLEVFPGFANLTQDKQVQLLEALLKEKKAFRIPKLPAEVPAALVPLFARCLELDPTKRPSAKEVFDALATVNKAYLVAPQSAPAAAPQAATSPSNKEAEEERKNRLEAEARLHEELRKQAEENAKLRAQLAAASGK